MKLGLAFMALKSDRARIFGKFLIFPKMGFLDLCKIESLVFTGNDLKFSVLLLANFLRKPHIWENSCSRDLGLKPLDQSDRSNFQSAISFEPFNCFLYSFA